MASINRYQGVDPVLTNVSIGYQNSAYIADQLFPTLPVAKQSGKHFIYDKGQFRVNDNLRGSGAASKEVTLNLTTGLPYFCEDHALKQFVTDEDMDGAVAPMDPMVDATENVTEMHMVAREVELAASLTSTGVMTQNTTLSGTSQWSDYSNSDPFSVIETGNRRSMRLFTLSPTRSFLASRYGTSSSITPHSWSASSTPRKASSARICSHRSSALTALLSPQPARMALWKARLIL